mgnify:FL=1
MDTTNPNTKGMQNSIDASLAGATQLGAEQSSLHSVPNEVKYGKDFRVPELPPILQAQLFGADPAQPPQLGQLPQPTTWFSAAGGSTGTQYKIKKFIDDIYQKEMKYRYHKQYVREDFLLTKSPIFDLQKFHNLRQKGDLLPHSGQARHSSQTRPKGTNILGLDRHGLPVLRGDSESLTNVLGFQAGGPNVVPPAMPALPRRLGGHDDSIQGEN